MSAPLKPSPTTHNTQPTVDTNAVRAVLRGYASTHSTLDYKTLTQQLGILPPQSIAKTTALLEAIQEDDALLDQPQLVSVVIQKSGKPMPRAGYYLKLKELGLYRGDETGSSAQMWHQNELEKVFEYYANKDNSR